MTKLKELLTAINRARVLRSSCSESGGGMFRVHLPEGEWDAIRRIAEECAGEVRAGEVLRAHTDPAVEE